MKGEAEVTLISIELGLDIGSLGAGGMLWVSWAEEAGETQSTRGDTQGMFPLLSLHLLPNCHSPFSSFGISVSLDKVPNARIHQHQPDTFSTEKSSFHSHSFLPPT